VDWKEFLRPTNGKLRIILMLSGLTVFLLIFSRTMPGWLMFSSKGSSSAPSLLLAILLLGPFLFLKLPTMIILPLETFTYHYLIACLLSYLFQKLKNAEGKDRIKSSQWLDVKKSIVLVAVVYLMMFIFFFLLPPSVQTNNWLNSLIPIDKSCVTDNDCTIAQIDCNPCYAFGKVTAVNKNYKPFCPFYAEFDCPAGINSTFEAICKNNQCVETNFFTVKSDS